VGRSYTDAIIHPSYGHTSWQFVDSCGHKPAPSFIYLIHWVWLRWATLSYSTISSNITVSDSLLVQTSTGYGPSIHTSILIAYMKNRYWILLKPSRTPQILISTWHLAHHPGLTPQIPTVHAYTLTHTLYVLSTCIYHNHDGYNWLQHELASSHREMGKVEGCPQPQ